jgi:aryl-alcohol dehydrogenase-like predicted oxidoreductase
LTSLQVSVLCFGGNVFGWTVDEEMAFRLLDQFTEAGGNFIDTANVYRRKMPGQEAFASEAIIGRWMKARGNRDRMIIGTKVGSEMAPDRKGLKKADVLREAEDSLRRLQTDYIDLYISHRADPETPVEETLEAHGQLLRQGKTRFIGASNHRPPLLREVLQTAQLKKLPAYSSLQPLYNLYDRAYFEKDLAPICAENGLGVTPYFSLAAGFLTGKYRCEADFTKSQRGKDMGKYLNERGFQILEVLDRTSLEVGETPATIALAWLINRPLVTSAIASATNPEQLNQLLASARISPSSLEGF